MCFKTNWSEIHWLNGNCSNNSFNATARGLHINHPVTSSIYITTAVLCLVLGLVTQFKYNSVKVLNLTVRSNVISNIPWIAYFIILFIRSVVGAVIYSITPPRDPKHFERLTAYFITDGALKSLEVLCLLWALHHQWLYKSKGFLREEIDNFNSGSGSRNGVMLAAARKIKNNKAGAIFMAQFILAMLFMILLEELNDVNKEEPGLFYWIYMAFFWTQCISTIFMVVLIAANQNEDGPTCVIKCLFVVGVIATLPGDIPSFIWSSCMDIPCKPSNFWTGYDFALFLSIPSAIIFFLVLRTEFLRLDQEAQYGALQGEVDSLFSVHSQISET